MNKLPTVTKTYGGLSKRDLVMRNDQRIKARTKDLKKIARDMDHLGDWLKKSLDLPVSLKRQFVADILYNLIPKRALELLPDAVEEFVSEETDATAFMGKRLRNNVTSAQLIAKEINKCAKDEED